MYSICSLYDQISQDTGKKNNVEGVSVQKMSKKGSLKSFMSFPAI